MTSKKNNTWIGKAAVAVLIGVGIFAFRYFELGQYLSLDYLKTSQEKFHQVFQSHRFAVIAAYMGIYIAVTALSLPGAAVMTLAGGGLLGLVVGTITVSFASTIGATLACVVSRFLLRDWVQGKFGDKLATINAGTVVFVNAGRQLAQIDSLSGILSPGVLVSFTVLGLFPITVKKLLAFYQRKFGKVGQIAAVPEKTVATPLESESDVQ